MMVRLHYLGGIMLTRGKDFRSKTESAAALARDDVHFAPESGEPQDAGRSHGFIIDPFGCGAGRDHDHENPVHMADIGPDQDWESGRHDAVE
jgi:hypothetical protein